MGIYVVYTSPGSEQLLIVELVLFCNRGPAWNEKLAGFFLFRFFYGVTYYYYYYTTAQPTAAEAALGGTSASVGKPSRKGGMQRYR